MSALAPPPPIVKGILLGLGAAAPLGPVNIQIVRRTLHGGFVVGAALGCGAVSVDVFYAILSTLSLSALAGDRRVIVPITWAGVLLLTYLGIQSVRSAFRSGPPSELAGADSASDGKLKRPLGWKPILTSYITGVLMTLLNPMTLAFWFVAVPTIAGSDDLALGVHDSRTIADKPFAPQAARWDLPMICAGVFAGTGSWVVFFAGTLSVARRWRRPWWMKAADLLGGAMLLSLAGATLWRSVRPFL